MTQDGDQTTYDELVQVFSNYDSSADSRRPGAKSVRDDPKHTVNFADPAEAPNPPTASRSKPHAPSAFAPKSILRRGDPSGPRFPPIVRRVEIVDGAEDDRAGTVVQSAPRPASPPAPHSPQRSKVADKEPEHVLDVVVVVEEQAERPAVSEIEAICEAVLLEEFVPDPRATAVVDRIRAIMLDTTDNLAEVRTYMAVTHRWPLLFDDHDRENAARCVDLLGAQLDAMQRQAADCESFCKQNLDMNRVIELRGRMLLRIDQETQIFRKNPDLHDALVQKQRNLIGIYEGIKGRFEEKCQAFEEEWRAVHAQLNKKPTHP